MPACVLEGRRLNVISYPDLHRFGNVVWVPPQIKPNKFLRDPTLTKKRTNKRHKTFPQQQQQKAKTDFDT